MKRIINWTVCFAAVFAAGCEFYDTESVRTRADSARAAASPSPAGEDDETAIRAAAAAFSEYFETGDTASLGRLYTEDALLLTPSDTVRGRGAIRRWFRPRQGGNRFEHSLETDDLTILGDVAIDRGRWSQTFTDEAGETRTVSGVYLVTWRRGADGGWRMEYDMWHAPYD